MTIVSEFKEFALKGNVMDLAVGVIIGAAFGKIIDSLVNDIIMPIIGRVIGGIDFSAFFFKLAEGPVGIPQTLAELKKAGVPVLAYGNFLTISLNFILLAVIIFLMVKQVNKLRKANPAIPSSPPEDVVLLTQIRDLLKRREE